MGTTLADNPRYLFSGLPAHSSSIRLQSHSGFHTRRIPLTAGPRFLAHFTRLTVVAALGTAGLLHAQHPLPAAPANPQPITPAPADPAIAAALQQVSPD